MPRHRCANEGRKKSPRGPNKWTLGDSRGAEVLICCTQAPNVPFPPSCEAQRRAPEAGPQVPGLRQSHVQAHEVRQSPTAHDEQLGALELAAVRLRASLGKEGHVTLHLLSFAQQSHFELLKLPLIITGCLLSPQ